MEREREARGEEGHPVVMGCWAPGDCLPTMAEGMGMGAAQGVGEGCLVLGGLDWTVAVAVAGSGSLN